MNKKTFAPQRKAFSLIELAIVVTILGLLIAGVTGGAALIKVAQLRSIASEARNYETAVISFIAKYDALPGDYGTSIPTPNAAAIASGTGNGDGNIEFLNGAATPVSETVIALNMLKNDGFLTGNFTPAAFLTNTVAALTPGTNANVPASKTKGNGWFLASADVGGVVRNVAVLFGGTTVASANLTNALTTASNANTTGSAALTPSDALSIDTKADDGYANSGRITALLTSCSTNADYTTATAYKACALAVQVQPAS